MPRAIAIGNDQGGLGIDPALKTPLIVSAVFHVGIFILSMVALPHIMREDIVMTPPINVEILAVEDISQTTLAAPPAPKKEAEDEPPPPKPEKPAPPQMQEPTPPKPAEAEPESVPEPAPAKEPEKTEPKPKPKPAPKPAPKKPEITKKEEPKKQEEAFSKLLKDLTPVKEEPAPTEQAGTGQGNPLSQVAQLSDRLSISEEDALRRQLSQCWNVLAGAKYAEDLVVEVRVIVNPDRTVQQAFVNDQLRYGMDSQFRAAADAALRALRNPKCTPLELPPEKYEQWKNTVIRFDPKDML